MVPNDPHASNISGCKAHRHQWLWLMEEEGTKSYVSISNQSFSLLLTACFNDLKNYRIPPFPIPPLLDQTVAGVRNNYPKGARVAGVITH